MIYIYITNRLSWDISLWQRFILWIGCTFYKGENLYFLQQCFPFMRFALFMRRNFLSLNFLQESFIWHVIGWRVHCALAKQLTTNKNFTDHSCESWYNRNFMWYKIQFHDLSKGISFTLHFPLETSLFYARQDKSLKSRNSLYHAPIRQILNLMWLFEVIKINASECNQLWGTDNK